MAQVIPLRPHTFRLDNCVIDDYAAEMGAMGVAVYTVLQRYADRATGQCWPSVPTIAAKLRLSAKCVRKYLHHLARLGLIDMAPRSTAEGDHTSNLYTVHDPTQPEALLRRRRQRGTEPGTGGRERRSVPPLESGNDVPYPPEPRAAEQDPEEQYLTSASLKKTAGQPCDNQAHEHRSPVPGLALCLDCFRCWEVPPAGSPAALAMVVGAGPQPPTACSP